MLAGPVRNIMITCSMLLLEVVLSLRLPDVAIELVTLVTVSILEHVISKHRSNTLSIESPKEPQQTTVLSIVYASYPTATLKSHAIPVLRNITPETPVLPNPSTPTPVNLSIHIRP